MADTLSQRFARGRIWTQVGGLCLGAPFLALTGVTSEIWVLYAALILYGAGRGIYDCNIMPVLCDVVGEDQRSTPYGLLNCIGTLSGGVIAYAAGALKAAVGIGVVLSAVGLLTLLSSLLLLRIPRLARRKQFVVDAQWCAGRTPVRIPPSLVSVSPTARRMAAS